jgi:hypothetical protein
VFLDVLTWAIIAGGTASGALALVVLTASRPKRKQARPGAWSGWKLLCAAGFLILSGPAS